MAFIPQSLHSDFVSKLSTKHTLRTCEHIKRRHYRSSVKACEPIYIDDPYGGFKGTRKSRETDAWIASGQHVPLRVSDSITCRIFTTLFGEQPSEAAVHVLVLPGFPCPSYMTRNMCRALANRAPKASIISLDWPGIGESDSPQGGVGGFDYDEQTATAAVGAVLTNYSIDKLSRNVPLCVVGHGFVGTNIAAAIAHAFQAAGCVFLSPAIGDAALDVPPPLRKLRNPILGPLLTGNPSHMADTVFTSASPYAVKESDMMVLRSPFLRSGGPGFAARAVVCNTNWPNFAAKAYHTIKHLNCPVSFATAIQDRWLNASKLNGSLNTLIADMNAGGNKQVQRVDYKYSGHFVFEDAPDDVAELIDLFIARNLL